MRSFPPCSTGPDQCAVRGRLATCLSLISDLPLSVRGSHPVSLRVIVGPSDGACSGPFRRRFGASFLTWALVSWKGLGVDRGVIRTYVSEVMKAEDEGATKGHRLRKAWLRRIRSRPFPGVGWACARWARGGIGGMPSELLLKPLTEAMWESDGRKFRHEYLSFGREAGSDSRGAAVGPLELGR